MHRKSSPLRLPFFLQPAPSTVGNREPRHWLYRAQFDKLVKYVDLAEQDQKKATLIEIGVNHQSMAPPSRHPEGGLVDWVAGFGEIPDVDATSLHRAVCLAATAALTWRYYNPPGKRHDWCLALAGLFRQLGVSADEAEKVVHAAATYAGDSDIKDRLGAICSTYKRGDHEPLTSSGKLQDLMPKGRDFVRSLRKIRESASDGTEWIVMSGGQLSQIVDRAETALLACPIYQRGGVLTRAVRLDKTISDPSDVRRDVGATVLIAVREPWLLEQMGNVLRWCRFTKSGDRTAADPQSIYARTLLSRGEWRFPVLRGIVSAPTLALDGRIIESSGFDAASGLLLDFVPGTFPPVPPMASQSDAGNALDRLASPLRAFPFVDKAAGSVAVSALLTALVRSSLRTAPLHAFDAPTAGTGKSLLAEMAGLLATGVRPPALSQGKSPEEDEKRLATVLFAGNPVIHIDNCERPLAGDFLCSMLTQEVVQARILGLSERRVLPSTALVLASGNNLTFAGDTSRRAVVCRLDAGTERPDTRAFDFDCHQEVLASRPELVVAGLTVLRAYRVAGSPVKLTPMGSFSDWEWIRGALVWLGCADPADTRDAILDNDPRKDELLMVMDAWTQTLGEQPVEVGELTQPEFAAVHDLLRDIACRGAWSSKSVGWWLRRHKDRVVDGRAFRCTEKRQSRTQWWLEGARRALFGDPPQWMDTEM
jgi:hypothetical protein